MDLLDYTYLAVMMFKSLRYLRKVTYLPTFGKIQSIYLQGKKRKRLMQKHDSLRIQNSLCIFDFSINVLNTISTNTSLTKMLRNPRRKNSTKMNNFSDFDGAR